MPKGIYNHFKIRGKKRKIHTLESREKLRLANLRRFHSGEKFGFQKGHKDLVSKEGRKRQGEKMRKLLLNGLKNNFFKNGKPWNYGKTGIFSKETLERISRKSKEMWKNEEVVKRILDSLYKTKGSGPNIPETRLLKILNELNTNYRFVGDFSFWINRANPDFVDTKHKRVIEMFGEYWHEKTEVKERTEYFQKYGYSTLVIWDYELKNEEMVKQKILDFEN